MAQNHPLIATLILAGIVAMAGCAELPAPEENNNPPTANTAPAPCPGSPGCPVPLPIVKSAWQKGKEYTLEGVTSYVLAAKASNQPLTLTTAPAYRKDPLTGKIEQADAVKNVVLRPLPTDKIARADKSWAAIVREFARQAALANVNEPMQLVVSTTATTRPRVTLLVKEGVASAKTSQKLGIEYVDAQDPKNALIFFQALDQKQFNQ